MLVYVLRDVLKKKPGDDEEEDNEDDGDIGLPYFLGSLSQYLQGFFTSQVVSRISEPSTIVISHQTSSFRACRVDCWGFSTIGPEVTT